MKSIATYDDGIVTYRLNRMTRHCTGIIARVAMSRAGQIPPPYPSGSASLIKRALVSLTVFLAKCTKVGQWFPSPSENN
ncbi:MAG: hypothetical protein K1V84_01070 [Muribaculaceae bacterium]